MKFCSDCGRQLEDDELFCPVCGAKAPDEAPETPAADIPAAEEVPAVEIPAVQIPAAEDIPTVDVPVTVETPTQTVGGFCPACGAPLEAGSQFCPACGASADGSAAPVAAVAETAAAAAPKKKLSAKHIGMLATGAAAVAVVALLGWLIFGLLMGGPNTKFLAHHQKIVASLSDKEFGSVVENYNRLATLSTDMTVTARVGDHVDQAALINRYLNNSSVNLKVDMNKTSAKVGGEVIFNGDSVVGGTAVYDKGTVGVQVPEFDDTYFTANLEELVENLTGERIEGLNSLEIPPFPEKSLQKALKTYMGVVGKAVTKKNTTAEKDSFRLDRLPGKRQDGTLYTFTPEAEDVEEMLEALAKALEKDKDLHKLAKDFLGSNVKLVNAALAEESKYDTLDEALDETLDEIAKEISGRNARSIGKDVENSDFTWKLWVGKGNVYKGEISTYGNNRICYERSDNGFALWTEYDPGYGEVYENDIMVLTYEKDGKLYNGQYVTDRYTLEFEDVNTSKRSALGNYYGTYTVYDSRYGLTINMEVEAGKTGGTDHVITMPNYKGGDGGYYYSYSVQALLNNMELVVNTTDKKSSLKTPSGRREDVTFYNMNEFSELFTDFDAAMDQVMTGVTNQIYNSYN